MIRRLIELCREFCRAYAAALERLDRC